MGSEQYRAWEFWLRKAFGKKFFPKPAMQVWDEFPPTTNEGAARVAESLTALRTAIKWLKRVEPWPQPWDGNLEPLDDPGRSPVELRPWREIIAQAERDRGRKLPVPEKVADELDRLQGREPVKRTKTRQRPVPLYDQPQAPLSQALRDKLRKELGFDGDAETES